MTTKVQKSVVVNAPLSTVYNQWTQFEEFPRFMNGVEQVTQLADDRLEWVAEIAGVRRQWIAKILEQVPDHKVAWAAVEGATNAGAVTFEEVGPTRTEVHLALEYEPEGLLENLGDKLKIVEKQAEGDLERFRDFIESEVRATGAWRGSINEGATVRAPSVEDAASSWGDSGKVGDPGWEPPPFVGEDIRESGVTGAAPAHTPPEPGNRGVTGAAPADTPPEPGNRGVTDAAADIGDPYLEQEPRRVHRDDDLH